MSRPTRLFIACLLALITALPGALWAQQQGPAMLLPADPALAGWVEAVEASYDPFLELQAIQFVHGMEGGVSNAEFARAEALLTQIEAAGLPEDDRLWLRALTMVANIARPHDAARSDALLARGLGDYTQQEPLREAQRKKFQGKTPADLGVEAWHAFMTRGPEDVWLRGCHVGFEAFAAPLPTNPRLRHALTAYYIPCVECGLSPLDGPLDLAEPILRLTAEVDPEQLDERLARLFTLSYGETLWYGGGPMRIPGDFGTTGNALKVFHAAINDHAPGALPDVLGVARARLAHHARDPQKSARWRALVDYLEAGAPDASKVDAALRSSDAAARRWALAWVTDQRAESLPHPFPFITDATRAEAIVIAARHAATPEERMLAADALRMIPIDAASIDGLLTVASGAGDPESSAINGALLNQVKALRHGYDMTQAPPEFLTDRLPKIQTAFHPRLDDPVNASALLDVLVWLGDPELDVAVAQRLRATPPPSQSFMHAVASTTAMHPTFDWRETHGAFQLLARDPNFEQADYAARVANDIQLRTP